MRVHAREVDDEHAQDEEATVNDEEDVYLKRATSTRRTERLMPTMRRRQNL